MGDFPSGQRGQTVNLLLFSFGGPNPPSPTTNRKPTASCLFFLREMVDSEARAHGVAARKPAGGRFSGRGLDLCSHAPTERRTSLPTTNLPPQTGSHWLPVCFFVGDMVDSEARAHGVAARKPAGGRFSGRGLDLCSHAPTERRTHKQEADGFLFVFCGGWCFFIYGMQICAFFPCSFFSERGCLRGSPLFFV